MDTEGQCAGRAWLGDKLVWSGFITACSSSSVFSWVNLNSSITCHFAAVATEFSLCGIIMDVFVLFDSHISNLKKYYMPIFYLSLIDKVIEKIVFQRLPNKDTGF